MQTRGHVEDDSGVSVTSSSLSSSRDSSEFSSSSSSSGSSVRSKPEVFDPGPRLKTPRSLLNLYAADSLTVGLHRLQPWSGFVMMGRHCWRCHGVLLGWEGWATGGRGALCGFLWGQRDHRDHCKCRRQDEGQDGWRVEGFSTHISLGFPFGLKISKVGWKDFNKPVKLLWELRIFQLL